MQYRVWCHNKKEWEKDLCLLTEDGNLHQMIGRGDRLIMCRKETHEVELASEEKDRNGNIIYAGDILKHIRENHVGVVDFKYGCFMTDCRGFGEDYLYELSSNEIERIGNIHENPELLK